MSQLTLPAVESITRNESLEIDKSFQKQRKDIINQGFSRGVMAARRMVSPDSYPVLREIRKLIAPELNGNGFNFRHRELGVTVMGVYRLSRHHLEAGPATDLITELIPTANDTIHARIGGLAVFGKAMIEQNGREIPNPTAKLAVEFVSDELEEESRLFAKEYANIGLGLRDYPGDGEYHPHCSFSLINKQVAYFKQPDTIARLDLMASLGEDFSQQVIDLEPIRRLNQ